MRDYQALLNQAVALVKPARGFIALCNPEAGTYTYVAAHEFTPEQSNYKPQMLFDLLAAGPALTNNTISQKYAPPGVVNFYGLHHILVAPLKTNGIADALLWCDRPVKSGVFKQDDLANIVALIQKEGWG